jgi:hypothetical protein
MRSSPAKRFTSEDLPAFGRPTTATRIAPDVDDGLLGAAEERELGVLGRRHRRGRVEDADDDVGLGDGDLDLPLDALAHGVAALGVEAAGVDERVELAARRGVAVMQVARHPGLVVDDRYLAADEPVEQRALAGVGAPDQRDDAVRRHRSRGRRGLVRLALGVDRLDLLRRGVLRRGPGRDLDRLALALAVVAVDRLVVVVVDRLVLVDLVDDLVLDRLVVVVVVVDRLVVDRLVLVRVGSPKAFVDVKKMQSLQVRLGQLT